jgi:beta-glucosidase
VCRSTSFPPVPTGTRPLFATIRSLEPRVVVTLAAALLSVSACDPAAAAPDGRPWLDARRAPDERAALAAAAMTLDEKIGLLHGPMALPAPPGHIQPKLPPEAIPGAGYVPGVARLGIPALYETDASLGIANPNEARPGDVATALPAALALASSFDPTLAYRAGALVGMEARSKGFNVLLGGGVNLARDPRNGRNFEYLGEDPLLAGLLAGESVRGTQDQHVISTVKHFALNANETNRHSLDARIERARLRESDLLAFNIAIDGGHPGAVMCAYNQVNGEYACGNHWLLNDVLKRDWRYPGWVMSDWGAAHGAAYAAAGLDQESGEQLDTTVFFDAPLRAAVAAGSVPIARLDDMVRRILRSMFAVGIVEHPPARQVIDYPAHALLALEIAQKGIVLLKNDAKLLPLARNGARIAVIGGYANVGVLSGGGSAQVIPSNGPYTRIPGSGGKMSNFSGQLFDPSAPVDAIQAAAPGSRVVYDAGAFPARAAALAAKSDVAIVFAIRHELEGSDIPNLVLPAGQDAVIQAVAAANPRTIVVLETGNPVAMPWIKEVPAVLESWYPGQEGGRAIADVIFGAVNPSGRLPMTFPREETDFVRPALPNLGSEPGTPVHIEYSEGADVGYRWYAAQGIAPRFAFGFGLSYTEFEYQDISVTGGNYLSIGFTVHNTGTLAGADVPQVYLTSAAGTRVMRLVGFARVELHPGQSRRLTLTADRRLLGSFDEARRRWDVAAGLYQVRIGRSAADFSIGGEARLSEYHGP